MQRPALVQRVMLDLHGDRVKEAREKVLKQFHQAKKENTDELYVITGRGNHINSNGSRGVLHKAFPRWLKKTTTPIEQLQKYIGAYQVGLIPQDATTMQSYGQALLNRLISSNSAEQLNYAKYIEQKAQSGDLEALHALAMLYLTGMIAGYDDKAQAVNLLKQAKQQGFATAGTSLGMLYTEGLFVKQHHFKAFKYFMQAAKQGDVQAYFQLGKCYLLGQGTQQSDAEALIWITKAAEQDHPEALYNLGWTHIHGQYTPQDDAKAFNYFKQAATLGVTEAMVWLARCYECGYGVEPNDSQAFDHYLRAAHAGNRVAQHQAGKYLIQGRGVESNPEQAFHWFLQAAQQGDGNAQAKVGISYLSGYPIPQDPTKALEWLDKAVAENSDLGQLFLGKVYLHGNAGVTPDFARALMLIRQAAESGLALAQYELALLYFNGEAIARDIPEGLKLLQQASQQQHVEAMDMLTELQTHFNLEPVAIAAYLDTLNKPKDAPATIPTAARPSQTPQTLYASKQASPNTATTTTAAVSFGGFRKGFLL